MEGLNNAKIEEQSKSKSQLEDAEKDLIRESIRAKLRSRSQGHEATFTNEELAIIDEDREEDRESRDLSGH